MDSKTIEIELSGELLEYVEWYAYDQSITLEQAVMHLLNSAKDSY